MLPLPTVGSATPERRVVVSAEELQLRGVIEYDLVRKRGSPGRLVVAESTTVLQ